MLPHSTQQGGSVPDVPDRVTTILYLHTTRIIQNHDHEMSILSDENRYKLLKLLEANPDMNQREVASTLGISLGKTNYCLKALIEKGWIKVGNFRRSQAKESYAYLLTPKGLEEKTRVTIRFFQSKQKEFHVLQQELNELRAEAAQLQKAESHGTMDG